MAHETHESPRNPWGLGKPDAPSRRALRGGAAAILLAAGALVLLTVLVYASGLWGEFLGPDHALFQRSPFLEPPSAPGAGSSALPHWLPRAVTTVSLALDRAVWGPLPAGFRTTNLLLHVLATLAAFALFLEWTGRRLPLALPAAVLFALHPIHVEAVETVGARGEILAALFIFLSLALLGRTRRGAAGGSLVLSLAIFSIATFASPIAFAVPIFLVLADALASETVGEASKRYGRTWALFALAALPALAVSLLVLPSGTTLNAWLSGRAGLLMAWLLVVPWPLSTYRIIGPARGLDALSILALLGAVALFAATLWVSRRFLRRPAPARDTESAPAPILGLGLLLALVPVALLAYFSPRPPGPDVPLAVLDHRLYLPSAGICLALVVVLAMLADRLSAPGPRRLAAVAIGALVVAGAYTAIVRSRLPVFANDVEMYADAATKEPRSAELRLLLAHAAAAREQTDRALTILTPVLEQRPRDAKLRLVIGNFHRDLGDLDKAESSVREALAIDPSLAAAHNTLGLIERDRGNVRGAETEYREAVRLDSALSEAHSNLGSLLVAYGAQEEAREELRRAVELDPTNGDAAANLASFLLRQNLQDEALAVLREGLRWSEGNPRLHYHVGLVLQRRGDREGARDAYQRAIALAPTYARPMNNLAVLLTEQKQYPDAIAFLERVVSLEPGNEQAHYNLGIAYRLSGDKTRAAAEFAAALKIRPDYREASRALTDMASGREPSLPLSPAR